MTAACQLAQDCSWPASARVALSRHPSGRVCYVTVVPIDLGSGGLAGCADHVHSHIDGMLMGFRGPMAPPRIEQAPGGTP